MYPEAKIIKAMRYWKLPSGKEFMLSEVCEKGEYFLTEKIDGYWYEFEKTLNHAYLFSRNESVATGTLSEKGDNVPHIMEALACLPPNTIVIGEIYVPGGTSKDTTKIMGCLSAEAIKRQETNGKVHYYLHDVIEYDGINLMDCGAEERYNILAAVWNKHELAQYDFLRLAVKVDTDLEAEISRILKCGGEGAVLKKKDAPYTPDKRPAWSSIKVKQMDAVDLVCVGFCPPTKEYTGKELETWDYWAKMVPVYYNCFEEDNCFAGYQEAELLQGQYFSKYVPEKFLHEKEHYIPVSKYYYLGWNTTIEVGAYDKEGNLIKVGKVSSGLTDEMREDMTKNPDKYLGRVVSLDCMSLDKKEKTLRHPALKCWRDDKNAKDCILEEIFA